MAPRTRTAAPASSLEATQVLDPHAMEHTQILDAHAMDRTQVIDPQALDATRVLDPLAAEATLVLPPPVAEDPILLDLPGPTPTFDVTPPTAQGASRRLSWKALGVAAAAVTLALGAWRLAGPGEAAPGTQAAAKVAVPADLEPQLSKAEAGDPYAMRTVATRYTYGLGVPANREEGLRWYRKAADAGSRVAREELKALEGR